MVITVRDWFTYRCEEHDIKFKNECEECEFDKKEQKENKESK